MNILSAILEKGSNIVRPPEPPYPNIANRFFQVLNNTSLILVRAHVLVDIYQLDGFNIKTAVT